MLKKQIQEIQDLKLCGYAQTELLPYFIDRGLTSHTRQAISKCYKMYVVPDNPSEKLTKDRVFDVDLFFCSVI